MVDAGWRDPSRAGVMDPCAFALLPARSSLAPVSRGRLPLGVGGQSPGLRDDRVASCSPWRWVSRSPHRSTARTRTSRSPPRAPAVPDPLTSLEAGVLPRADLVVLGKVRIVRPAGPGGPTIARVGIEKTIRGTPPDDDLTLFVGGPRNTADASRPSTDYFEGRTAGRYVLFLTRTPNASGYELASLFLADDLVGNEKVRVLVGELALQAVTDPLERARQTVPFLVGLLSAEFPWTRVHGAKELSTLSISAPRAFPPETLAEIEAARRGAVDEAARIYLGRVVERLGTGTVDAGAPRAGAPRRRIDPSPTAAFLKARGALATCTSAPERVRTLSVLAREGGEAAAPDLLGALTRDPDATVRERAAVLLGDVQAPEALAPVLAAFATEKDGTVREALIRAAGLLGNASTVPWLVERLESRPLWTALAYAFARLRTPAALAALEDLRSRACGAVPPDDALVRLVEYLRSPAFVEAERLAGRSIAPTGPAPAPAAPVAPPAPVDTPPR